MERRLSERVQFFQCPQFLNSMPATALSPSRNSTAAGLLLDVSDDGVQILTTADITEHTDTFQLMIDADDATGSSYAIATMQRQWSKPEDANFMRSGFAFTGDVELMTLLDNVLDARDAGQPWFHCRLVSVIQPIGSSTDKASSRKIASGVC